MNPRTPDPVALEFVRFCYRRRHVGWPELYDEMCAVAARGLFKGMDADDLAGLGIGFSLFGMPALSVMAGGVIAEEQARRRPVAVAIVAELAPLVIEEWDAQVVEVASPESAAPDSAAPESAAARSRDERSFDVPVRVAGVPVAV